MKGRIALTVVLLAAAGCSGSGGKGSDSTSAGSGAPASGTAVELKLLMFSPGKLTVKTGSTVTWRNAEPITHTVTSGSVSGVDPGTGLRSGQKPDGMFDRKLAGKGDTFSFRFDRPGTYSYFCSIHQGMNATVVVTA